MAVFKSLAFLVCCFVISEGNSSFSFNGFGESSSVNENIVLFGDSKVVSGGSSIQLTDSVSRSEGRVLYRKPIKLSEGKERNYGSFSTYFSFSMSDEIGSGLAFFMVPSGLDLRLFSNKDNSSSGLGFLLGYANNQTEVVAVEFGTSKNGNRVGIVLDGLQSAKMRNLSSLVNSVLNNGEKLHCWTDYEASSKRLEVRLSKSRVAKPVDPLISYSIDLAKLCKDGKFMVGLSSSNGNSSEAHFLYSWSFKLRHLPMWMHSQPLDPKEVSKNEKENGKEKPVIVRKRSDCILRMLGALVLGAACGTLGAMSALYLWTICSGRRPMAVVPEECTVKPVDAGLEHKKVEVVVVDKAAGEEGKK